MWEQLSCPSFLSRCQLSQQPRPTGNWWEKSSFPLPFSSGHQQTPEAQKTSTRELEIKIHTGSVNTLCDISVDLNRILYCDHSLESTRRADSNKWSQQRNRWEINKLGSEKHTTEYDICSTYLLSSLREFSTAVELYRKYFMLSCQVCCPF